MFGGVALVDLSPLDGSPVSLTPPLEVTQKAAEGWDSKEELLDQACEARDYEAVGRLCIMSRRSRALEYSSKVPQQRQTSFGNDHSIAPRSLELLASICAETGKADCSEQIEQCTPALTETLSENSVNEPIRNAAATIAKVCTDMRLRQNSDSPSSTTSIKASTCRHPTSILRKRLIIEKDENGLTHQRKRNDRRVRFQEPEIIVHAYETADNKPHFALLTCVFIFLSLLGVMLYCADRRRHLKMCEELESMLIVYFLQVKQVVWGCWQWLMKL
ncbi:nutritionally-regulated adipose and cardiac enriched protein homolog [Polypterus senegalus]|uniref:nutritionally-regulated adipose and cardiac enriched protein homolog n=1 Tax=Polypterus senegalus TaxID=55291 RepID=UPI001964955D|nr:nutritionally-regulated adipose and cardiac enriched protein homolog [Polypterus senegalus]